jgi:PIN domain nuclease of toxin-antitoxin system
VNVLLDTSTLLWTLADPDRLSAQAREAISTELATLSVVSYWEVVIKTRKGLLPIPDPVGWWTRAVTLFHGRVLPIRTTHVTALAALPDLHRDPFDRMLIAQSMAEGWPLVANDEQIRAYPARTIW